MKKQILPAFLAGMAAATAVAVAIGAGRQQQASGDNVPQAQDMAEMMKKAARYTQPGANHELLRRFLGRWDTVTRITMSGQETPGEKGTSEFTWLMEGRWLKQESQGTFLGTPIRGFGLLGYDNLKRSYVVCAVSSMDTAMSTAEGDLDPRGNVLITYGTIDEYLTGEHDKMVKTVWRFLSDDKIVQEIHDLPIGEHGTKVVEIVYTRKK